MRKAVLTDIEGTTTSLAFVKEVLFPYARQHISGFVEAHAEDKEVAACVAEVRCLSERGEMTLREVGQCLVQWIDTDQKVTPLKTLQGLLWAEGYRQGRYYGHVYPDAVECLRAWKAQGLSLSIYSSGSVLAQQLLFQHTEYGDLTPLFSGYFDTQVGGKKEQASYVSIAKHLGLLPEEICFLSDIKEELEAAAACGYECVWLQRDGEIDSKAIPRQVKDFYALKF